MNSKLFTGTVQHRRFIHSQHQFQYKLFMLYIDLDELDSIFKPYWLWSAKRFNIAYFKRRCYLGDPRQPLLNCVKQLIKTKTQQEVDKVFLLTHFAYLGYCFNPVSFYFCMRQGKLTHIIAEVTNTPWAERCEYILTANCIQPNIYESFFKKRLHVSPFLEMDYHYHLRCKLTSDTIIIYMENLRDQQCHFDATLTLSAQPITHKTLAKSLWHFPWMTGKVITTIYWQALKLWCKRTPFIEHKAKIDD